MSNHLFIGLGGTGCAVIREFKKLLFAEWRRKGGTGDCPDLFEFKDRFGGQEESVRIATLSIDSNKGDLDGGRDQWIVLGEQIGLRDNEKVLITPQGLGAVFANLKEYPGIEPWVGNDREQMAKVIRGTEQPTGCNQIRRLGRLALANGNNLENVLKAVGERRMALTKGGSLNMDIHISCTLGCGTGSGTLLDTISQIRLALQKEQGTYKIFLYLFATSSDVGAVNTGNFYANQYAALQELNRLRLGLYHPWDIRARPISKRATINDPFDAAFIITDATENNQRLTLPQQVHSVAEMVFQKLVRLMGNVPKRLGQAYSFEDVSLYAADEGGGDRATRFGSFGVKRLSIPEHQIRGKMTYTYVGQGLLRLLYNNWSGRDGEGYAAVAKPFGDDAFVEKAKARWGITTDHLNCNIDRPLQAEDPYPQFLVTWGNECEQLSAEVIEGVPNFHDWVAEFDDLVEGFWRQGFRSKGVESYFGVRSEPNGLVTRARQIARAVEQDLCQGMLNLSEDYPVHYFPAIVRRAITHLEIAKKSFSQELKELPEQIQKAVDDRDLNREELQRVGKISEMMGKHRDIFAAYQRAAQDYYYLDTTRIAAEYAVKLIDHAIPEFAKLEHKLENFAKMLKQVYEDREALADHLIVEGVTVNSDPSSEVQFYVKAKEINDSIHVLKLDKVSQDAHARRLAEKLRLLKPEGEGFEKWLELTREERDNKVGGPLVIEIDMVATSAAQESHEQRRVADKNFIPILGQNIIEKLYRDYGGTVRGELETRIRSMMESAMPAAAFDGGAMPLGYHGVTSPIFHRTVFLPECDSVDPAFRASLKSLIETMTGGGQGGANIAVEVADVPAGRNGTEIVFFGLAYFFPLRMMNTIQGLHKEHAARLAAGEEDAIFQIYSENHQPPLPSLLRPDESKRRQEAFPWVILAEALGLLHVPKSSDGQPVTLQITEINSVGRAIDPVPLDEVRCSKKELALASELVVAPPLEISLGLVCLVRNYQESFRMTNLRPLQEKIGAKMPGSRNVQGREDLLAKLDQMLDSVFVIQDRQEDEAYQFFADGISKAKKMVELAGK